MDRLMNDKEASGTVRMTSAVLKSPVRNARPGRLALVAILAACLQFSACGTSPPGPSFIGRWFAHQYTMDVLPGGHGMTYLAHVGEEPDHTWIYETSKFNWRTSSDRRIMYATVTSVAFFVLTPSGGRTMVPNPYPGSGDAVGDVTSYRFWMRNQLRGSLLRARYGRSSGFLYVCRGSGGYDQRLCGA
jgi:hypothetical protein